MSGYGMAARGAKRPFAKTLMSALCRFCCESLFGVVNDKFLEALMRFTLGHVRGPYRFIQNRSWTSLVALKTNAAEKSKDQPSRDF